MIQLNLVPNIKQEYLKTQQTKRVIALTALGISGFVVAIVILLAVTVYGLQKKHISDLNNDIDVKTAEIQGIPQIEKILTVQSQLKALPGLHDQVPKTTRVFDFLGDLTPSDISLQQVLLGFGTGQTSAGLSSFQITGRATSFKAVNRYVDTIKNANYRVSGGDKLPAFNSVVLSSIGQDAATTGRFPTGFVLSFNYDSQIFLRTNASVDLIIPKIASSVSRTEKPFSGGGN